MSDVDPLPDQSPPPGVLITPIVRSTNRRLEVAVVLVTMLVVVGIWGLLPKDANPTNPHVASASVHTAHSDSSPHVSPALKAQSSPVSKPLPLPVVRPSHSLLPLPLAPRPPSPPGPNSP